MNIEAKDLSKVYNSGENRVIALDHANLEIVSSDFISIKKIFTVTATKSCLPFAANGSGLFFSNSTCFPF